MTELDSNKVYFADFYRYCKICKYYSTSERKNPCAGCLTVPGRQGTRKPINYEEDKR